MDLRTDIYNFFQTLYDELHFETILNYLDLHSISQLYDKPEPGIRRGNEDSRGKKFIFHGKTN